MIQPNVHGVLLPEISLNFPKEVQNRIDPNLLNRNLQFKFPVLSGYFQNALSLLDARRAIATLPVLIICRSNIF